MSRAFFDLVADALMGFLPPDLRDHAHTTSGANLKVWYEPERREHYEVQLIGKAALRAARVHGPAPALEIGFHAEHPDAAANERALGRIAAAAVRARLGRAPARGAFVGRPSPWRRMSELWHEPDLEDDATAIEAAERLGAYIDVVERLRRA